MTRSKTATLFRFGGMTLTGLCATLLSVAAICCVTPALAIAAEEPHRSPTDLVLSPDEAWLVSANHTARSLSLLRLSDGAVVHELEIGERPANVVLLADGHTLLATTQYGGELVKLRVAGDKLEKLASLSLRFEPQGIAVTRDGKTAYVALSSGSAVAVVDVESLTELQRIPVGLWPRTLALSPDETRLAVSASGDRGVGVVDTAKRERLYQADFNALNVGQMQVSNDNKYVYFPWMVYRHNPIDARNIRLGWVLASRIARLKLEGPARREALSLDPPGEA
ncbi:MAG TPA: beta-propeller fold lactonase family protein, partial [Pirellulales bacterium]